MSGRSPIHLDAKPGDVAPLVIAVGDPGRARRLAEGLLEDARMVASNRGFLVFTGYFRGSRVTVATHGVGAPSAAIVFEELAMLGARTIVRLGTTGSLRGDLELGDVVVAAGAGYYCGSTAVSLYSRGSGLCLPSSPDPLLAARLYEHLSRSLEANVVLAPVLTSDAFYAESEDLARLWSSLGMASVEMELSILFALSWMRGFRSAGVLIVSDTLMGGFRHIDKRVLEGLEVSVGRAVLEAASSID